MSEALAFDSHQFVRRLTDSGFTGEQVEALAPEQDPFLKRDMRTRSSRIDRQQA